MVTSDGLHPGDVAIVRTGYQANVARIIGMPVCWLPSDGETVTIDGWSTLADAWRVIRANGEMANVAENWLERAAASSARVDHADGYVGRGLLDYVRDSQEKW